MENIGEELRNFIIKKSDIKLIKLIGKGAYGSVYKGEFLNTEVAVKIFKSSKLKSKIQKKFIQEAEIMCSCWSPYIVLFMGVCLNSDRYMLITELMKNSLYELLHI